VFSDGWLKTGDVGSLDGEGRLTVLARRTDLIISGGENIYPAEIEHVLKRHPFVQDAAVTGKASDRWGSVPVAVVVARKPTPSDHDLETWCRARLAGFKIPKRFVFLDALPTNAMGKVDRGALARLVNK
jgi:O-succinylbenzoic acid--CoA ligase